MDKLNNKVELKNLELMEELRYFIKQIEIVKKNNDIRTEDYFNLEMMQQTMDYLICREIEKDENSDVKGF